MIRGVRIGVGFQGTSPTQVLPLPTMIVRTIAFSIPSWTCFPLVELAWIITLCPGGPGASHPIAALFNGGTRNGGSSWEADLGVVMTVFKDAELPSTSLGRL